jgi:hypothetical protein
MDQTAPPPSRAHWTPAKQRIFLTALLETGSVALAAKAAGMSRSSAHRLRTRLAGTPFARLWDLTVAEHARRLADPFGGDLAASPSEAEASASRGRGPGVAPEARASRAGVASPALRGGVAGASAPKPGFGRQPCQPVPARRGG